MDSIPFNQDQVARQYSTGKYSIAKLAKIHKCSRAGLSKFLNSEGLISKVRNANLDEEQMLLMYVDKMMGIKEIARELKTNPNKVSEFLNKKGVTRGYADVHNVPVDKDEVMKLWSKYGNFNKVGEELGLSRKIVRNRLVDWGVVAGEVYRPRIPKSKQKNNSKYKFSESMLKDLYVEKGLTTTMIANKVGCNHKTVNIALRKFNIPIRSATVKPAEIPNSIKKRYEGGETLVNLASELGVHPSRLSSWLKDQNIIVRKSSDYSNFISSQEIELSSLISSWGFKVETQLHVDNFIYDLYIPSVNLLIEYNGMYWHSSEKKGKDYHRLKYECADNHGMGLVNIWGSDWKNERDKVKDILKYRLGLTEIDICDYMVDNKLDASYFSDESVIGKKYVGLSKPNKMLWKDLELYGVGYHTYL